jgi:hypothetical protein
MLKADADPTKELGSVADPGCLSRIPNSVFSILDPDPHEEFKYF